MAATSSQAGSEPFPLDIDSFCFHVFRTLTAVPWGAGIPIQPPKLQNFNFLTYHANPFNGLSTNFEWFKV